MKKKVIITSLLVVMAAMTAIYPHASAYSSAGSNAGDSALIAADTYVPASTMIDTVPAIADGQYVADNTDREMRGTWIATVKNTNLPAGMDKATFQAWAEESLELLRINNFNTVVFQVRPTGDTLYQSTLAPWSSFITGKAQGADPGYDPLQIMTDTAHAKGIELHAWINPYRITMPSDNIENLSEDNIAKLHPEWLVKYGSQYYLNPGIPEVRQHLVAIVSEIVENYDVDAIHMDDYFYPYSISGQEYGDGTAFAQYGYGYASLGDWRRDNVTKLIREAYATINASKSYVQLGVSPFGVWRNIASDPTGSDTNAGHECYDSLYADTRLWISEGIIDYITPQIYWSTEFKVANYNTLVSWWQKEIDTYAVNKPVNLYIGLADYKVNNNADVKWSDPGEIQNQVNINRLNTTVLGQMHYSINSVKADSLNHISSLKANQYNTISLTPGTHDHKTISTMPVLSVTGTKSDTGTVLTIQANDVNTRKFAVYRFDGNTVGEFTNTNIIAVTYKTENANTMVTDTNVVAGKTYTYAVKPISSSGIMNNSYKTVMVTG